MSVEALAFAKLTDLDDAESPSARLLFYIIAENTFNDSGLCRVGKAELAYQMRASANTVRRQAQALDDAGKIKVRIKPGEGTGRQPDEIELLGFKKWLSGQRSTDAGSSVSQTPEPQNAGGQSAKLAGRGNPPKATKRGGGNPPLVADWNKDTRTSNRTRQARNSDLGSEVPPGWHAITRLGSEWQHWIDHLSRLALPLADEMRSSRTFMAYVPHKLPRTPADRPVLLGAKSKVAA